MNSTFSVISGASNMLCEPFFGNFISNWIYPIYFVEATLVYSNVTRPTTEGRLATSAADGKLRPLIFLFVTYIHTLG